MTGVELLLDLSGRGIRFWAEGDGLGYRAPQGALSSNDKQLLLDHKFELLTILRRADGIPATWHPSSYGQKALWYMQQMEPGSSRYNLHQNIEISGSVHPESLARALGKVIRRHGALRTRFIQGSGQLFQVVVDSNQNPLVQIDLREQRPGEHTDLLSDLLAEERERPFNLENDFPLRTLLIQTEPDNYLLNIVVHHIAFDGWSLAIFMREILSFYRADIANGSMPQADRPFQFTDYARWEYQRLDSRSMSDALAYWRHQLEGIPPLEIPSDLPNVTRQPFQNGWLEFGIPTTLANAVKTLAQQEGVTPFVVFLAAFKTLLFRYTGQSDFGIGSPVAGRHRSGTDEAIGFFSNPLVLRTRLNADFEFRTILRLVQDSLFDAFRHQDVPYAKLVEELWPEHSQHSNPLYQVMIIFEEDWLAGMEIPGLLVMQASASWPAATTDLDLTIKPSDKGFIGNFSFNRTRLNPTTVERMTRHFLKLLHGIVANPALTVSQLPILQEDELHQILVEWNQTKAIWPEEVGIVSMFEAQASMIPDAVAYISDGKSLTYQELNARANRLAHRLREVGVKSESVVGIYVARSLDFMVAVLAVYKSGGVYLPLDRAYPNERLSFMVREAEPLVILTHGSPLPFDHRAAEIDTSDDRVLLNYPVANIELSSDPDELAYIIYTSGSTGRPKGIAVQHRQILNRLHWMWGAYPFTPDEVGCQKTSLNFVDSLWEIFGYLLRGIPTVIIDDESVRDVSVFIKTLARHRVTRLWLVPSLLRSLLEIYPDLQAKLPQLRFWVTSGESISNDVAAQFRKQLPTSTLFNLYGTSEIWDATWYAPTMEHNHLRNMPIGKPIDNVQCYVLDGSLQPVPVGVVGELFVGGDGVATGYLNSPGRTVEHFLPDPFNDRIGSRFYKTGDLARWLPDGNIDLVGRVDRQVKISGYRIELGEIESWINKMEAVRYAAVKVEPMPSGDIGLVAYIEPNNTLEISQDAVEVFLRTKLPDYMIPSLHVFLDEFPLTTSGKLDRIALPKPDWGSMGRRQEYLAPRNPTEQRLVKLWGGLLGRSQIGVRDDFFELGGHSLLAVRLLARVEAEFGILLPLTWFLDTATVERMARSLTHIDSTGESATLVKLHDGDGRDPLFIVTAGYGDMLALGRIAAYMSLDSPIYGLQPPGEWIGGEVRNLRDLIEAYLQAIHEVHSDNSYRLAGYCSGGLVAYELARQARKAGYEIEKLILLETPFSYRRHIHALYIKLRSLLNRFLQGPDKTQWRLSTVLRALFVDEGLAQHLEVLAGYKALDYDGSLILIQAQWSHIRFIARKSKWKGVSTGSVERVIVSGDHDNFIRGQRADELARQIGRALHE